MIFKQFVVVLATLLPSTSAWANDGGMSGIRVNDIRMREYEIKNGEEKEKRRISNPNFKITFSGAEARKLQQTLPSTHSVITHMQPELEKIFNESFKGLGIYSEKTSAATAKVIAINCSDAKLETDGNGKAKIIKTGVTTCEISIQAGEAGDALGDVAPYEPGSMCRQQ